MESSGLKHIHVALLLVVALVMSGCAATRPVSGASAAGSGDIASWSAADCRNARKVIVRTARSRIGCPYRNAGKGPSAFDCSGLTAFAYNAAGLALKPTSSQQFTQGKFLGKHGILKPGDLVFFGGSKDTKTVSHVGIVVSYRRSDGSFTFIHAANTGVEIQKSTASYYKKRYLGARRILAY